MIGLLKHNLRVSYRRSWSYIDANRSHLNLVRTDKNPAWQFVDDERKRQNIFTVLNARYQTILTHFKNELTVRNQIFLNRKCYKAVKNWQQYASNKNITGEWIISASRSWFVDNAMIKIDDQYTFTVINLERILTWATHAHNWAQEKITTLFHKDAFLASFLHLDESNVHLHCQHVQFLYKFDARQQKMAHAFTRPRRLTPFYMSELRQQLQQYLRTQLQRDRFAWTIMTPSYDPKTGLDLYHFKINNLQQQLTQLQQKIKTHQLRSELQIELSNHRFNQDLLQQLQLLDSKTVVQIYKNLLRLGYDRTFLQQRLLLRVDAIQLQRTMTRQQTVNWRLNQHENQKIC